MITIPITHIYNIEIYKDLIHKHSNIAHISTKAIKITVAITTTIIVLVKITII